MEYYYNFNFLKINPDKTKLLVTYLRAGTYSLDLGEERLSLHELQSPSYIVQSNLDNKTACTHRTQGASSRARVSRHSPLVAAESHRGKPHNHPQSQADIGEAFLLSSFGWVVWTRPNSSHPRFRRSTKTVSLTHSECISTQRCHQASRYIT